MALDFLRYTWSLRPLGARVHPRLEEAGGKLPRYDSVRTRT
ncbi:MAG: hypothetical protein AAGB97_03840 [Dehalococcoidia bacterium]